MSNTPKFDKLIAKFVKAGTDVKVTEHGRSKEAVVASGPWANYCIANVTVYGTVENLVQNTKMKSRLGIR
jgi:hypothetical protein